MKTAELRKLSQDELVENEKALSEELFKLNLQRSERR